MGQGREIGRVFTIVPNFSPPAALFTTTNNNRRDQSGLDASRASIEPGRRASCNSSGLRGVFSAAGPEPNEGQAN